MGAAGGGGEAGAWQFKHKRTTEQKQDPRLAPPLPTQHTTHTLRPRHPGRQTCMAININHLQPLSTLQAARCSSLLKNPHGREKRNEGLPSRSQLGLPHHAHIVHRLL